MHVCQKTSHKAEGCWFGDENKIRDAELALAKTKAESERSLRQRGLLPLRVRCSLLVLLLIHRTDLLVPLIFSRVSFLRHACLFLLSLPVLLHCTKATALQQRLLSLRCLCVSVPRPLYLTKCLYLALRNLFLTAAQWPLLSRAHKAQELEFD
jgi:hypothetical protein